MTEYALRPGTVLHGNSDYTIERTLGAGGFGVTYLARTTVLFGNIPQTKPRLSTGIWLRPGQDMRFRRNRSE